MTPWPSDCWCFVDLEEKTCSPEYPCSVKAKKLVINYYESGVYCKKEKLENLVLCKLKGNSMKWNVFEIAQISLQCSISRNFKLVRGHWPQCCKIWNSLTIYSWTSGIWTTPRVIEIRFGLTKGLDLMQRPKSSKYSKAAELLSREIEIYEVEILPFLIKDHGFFTRWFSI